MVIVSLQGIQQADLHFQLDGSSNALITSKAIHACGNLASSQYCLFFNNESWCIQRCANVIPLFSQQTHIIQRAYHSIWGTFSYLEMEQTEAYELYISSVVCKRQHWVLSGNDRYLDNSFASIVTSERCRAVFIKRGTVGRAQFAGYHLA